MPASRTRLRLGVIAVVPATLVLAIATSAQAGAQVTRGDFHTFAGGAGLEYDISGHATMVRTADGKTIVSVHVEGLHADTNYDSHVHKQACNDGDADGHYKFDPSGPVNAINEIWPLSAGDSHLVSNAAGIANGDATNQGTAAPSAMSVVIHAPGGTKIACADLQ